MMMMMMTTIGTSVTHLARLSTVVTDVTAVLGFLVAVYAAGVGTDATRFHCQPARTAALVNDVVPETLVTRRYIISDTMCKNT